MKSGAKDGGTRAVPAHGNRAAVSLTVSIVGMSVISGCESEPPAAVEVDAAHVETLPSTQEDAAWRGAPVYMAPLLPQDMVEPRLLDTSTATVRVQALTDGERVAFRLNWADDTLDDLPGASRFSDACAVQLPASPGPDLPAPQMGETGKPVEMTYWTAAWQAEVDGRPLETTTLYPNASVDHYPFEAPSLEPGSEEQRAMELRYAPARAVDRPDHPADRPVQDLVAEGPGTITAAERTASDGHGRRMPWGWDVILVRPLSPVLRAAARSHVAFAVWDGGREEVGARKMRSVWIPMRLGGTP